MVVRGIIKFDNIPYIEVFDGPGVVTKAKPRNAAIVVRDGV